MTHIVDEEVAVALDDIEEQNRPFIRARILHALLLRAQDRYPYPMVVELHWLGRLSGVEVRAQLEKTIQSDAYRRIPEQVRRELPNADPATVDRVARIRQRQVLEQVVSRTRGRERKTQGGVILELTTQPASGQQGASIP